MKKSLYILSSEVKNTMVSAQYYIKAFFSSMKERNRILGKKLAQKMKIDVRVLKSKSTGKDRVALLDLIGKDDMLRTERKKGIFGHVFGPKGVSLQDQSLRYLMKQMLRSASVFEKVQEDLANKAQAEQVPDKIGRQFFTYIAWIDKKMPAAKNYALQLNELYAKEAAALNKLNMTEYLKLVAEERKLMENYAKLNQEFAKQMTNQVAKVTTALLDIEDDTLPLQVILPLWYFGLMAFSYFVVPAAAQSGHPGIAAGLLLGLCTMGGAITAGLLSLVRDAITKQERLVWGK